VLQCLSSQSLYSECLVSDPQDICYGVDLVIGVQNAKPCTLLFYNTIRSANSISCLDDIEWEILYKWILSLVQQVIAKDSYNSK